MGAKKKVAVVGIPLAALLTIVGGMTLNLDFSSETTNIGQIGDNIINNYIQNELGISLDKYRENCKAGVYENSQAGQFCDIFI